MLFITDLECLSGYKMGQHNESWRPSSLFSLFAIYLTHTLFLDKNETFYTDIKLKISYYCRWFASIKCVFISLNSKMKTKQENNKLSINYWFYSEQAMTIGGQHSLLLASCNFLVLLVYSSFSFFWFVVVPPYDRKPIKRDK